jgi:transcriptional regulator with XRE-family HTH domain
VLYWTGETAHAEGIVAERATSALGQWIIDECAARGLSWAEASRRAGVDKSTVSLIIRGQRPGLETCRALAGLFEVPTEQVLRLAGHLESNPDQPLLSPAIRALALEVEKLPPQAQERVLDVWRAALQAIRSVAAESDPPAD